MVLCGRRGPASLVPVCTGVRALRVHSNMLAYSLKILSQHPIQSAPVHGPPECGQSRGRLLVSEYRQKVDWTLHGPCISVGLDWRTNQQRASCSAPRNTQLRGSKGKETGLEQPASVRFARVDRSKAAVVQPRDKSALDLSDLPLQQRHRDRRGHGPCYTHNFKASIRSPDRYGDSPEAGPVSNLGRSLIN